MDFFAEQSRSRGKTTQLVILFIIAVAGIVLSVYTVIVMAFGFFSSQGTSPSTRALHWFNWDLFLAISIITVLVIAIGSIFKIIALGKGGSYVAESLGGRLINRGTTNTDERKLLNVVEEMAIASGIPVPQVYVLEGEEGINAFAAGYTTNDAIVAVTRGCMTSLTRDELQGVIAHEFSHIFNGDMRLNIRIIGLLSGILIIANIGYFIMRAGSRSRKGGAQAAIAGLGLLAIGYVGVFAGRIIQAAISRQREFLADASAVQFTRNPSGIAGALKKIGGFARGSKIKSPAASETCHMFFSSAINLLFATHPSLTIRIRRIDPSFDGKFEKSKLTVVPADELENAFQSFDAGSINSQTSRLSVDPDEITGRAGNISPQSVQYSSALLAALPDKIQNELQDIFGASAVVCALLLDANHDERENQLNILGRVAPDKTVKHIRMTAGHMKGLDPRMRLPLLDLAFPALRQMSLDQYRTLLNHIKILIEADKKISLYEFCFNEAITHRLGAAFNASSQKVTFKNLHDLVPDIINLVSVLAYAGHDNKDTEAAFKAAMYRLPARTGSGILSRDQISLQSLHETLSRLALASPGIKRTVFDACAHCVLYDKTVTVEEAELLRAIAYSMDIPVPPFLSDNC